jgi:CpeT protein
MLAPSQPMLRRLSIATLIASMSFLTACSHLDKPVTAAPLSGLEELQGFMVGYFNSADQARDDKDFFNIELRVVPVWADRKDGPWLYIEQADAKTPEKPYRQRVYRLVKRGDLFESRVYEFKGDPLRFAGAWRKPTPLSEITAEDLVERVGCAVIMKRTEAGRFQGATDGKECISTLRGAAYATAEVDVTAKTLKSWDRGMAADGRQVWGSTKGGYVFVKRADKPV